MIFFEGESRFSGDPNGGNHGKHDGFARIRWALQVHVFQILAIKAGLAGRDVRILFVRVVGPIVAKPGGVGIVPSFIPNDHVGR